MESTLPTIIIGALSFLVGVLITRWVFSIDRQLKNQRAIIWLLMKIGMNQGLTDQDISDAKKFFDIK